MFNEQLKKEWPGLIQECDNLCEDLELPKVSKNKLSKRDINNALQEKTRSVLIEKMKTSSKMEDKVEEAFQRKEYFDNKVISEVRAMFAARSGMFKCKMNHRNDPQFKRDLWFCDDCSKGAVDTLSHVLICPAHQNLREGKDISCDKDLAQYYLKVQLAREKAKKC